MKGIGLIDSEKDIESELLIDIKTAYVIYDHERNNAVEHLLKTLNDNDIFSIGRYGRWEYSAMEDAILQGKEIAEKINES